MRPRNRFSRFWFARAELSAEDHAQLAEDAKRVFRLTGGMVEMFPPEPKAKTRAGRMRVAFFVDAAIFPCRGDADAIAHLAGELRRLALRYTKAAERLEGGADE